MDTRIPELRKARRLSQQELADAVGVTRQTITSLEVGKYTASLVLAYKLARYFRASHRTSIRFQRSGGITYVDQIVQLPCKERHFGGIQAALRRRVRLFWGLSVLGVLTLAVTLLLMGGQIAEADDTAHLEGSGAASASGSRWRGSAGRAPAPS